MSEIKNTLPSHTLSSAEKHSQSRKEEAVYLLPPFWRGRLCLSSGEKRTEIESKWLNPSHRHHCSRTVVSPCLRILDEITYYQYDMSPNNEPMFFPSFYTTHHNDFTLNIEYYTSYSVAFFSCFFLLFFTLRSSKVVTLSHPRHTAGPFNWDCPGDCFYKSILESIECFP